MFNWIIRLHFAFVLLICGELIGWQQASTYRIQDWVLVFLIYMAAGSLLLDIISRWKVDSFPTLLLTAGLFGLIEGTLITLAARDSDNAGVGIVFRPMGLEVLMFLLAFWMFRLALSGRQVGTREFIVLAVVGAGWGIWVRWFPELEYNRSSPTLEGSLPFVLMGLFLAGVIPVGFSLFKSPGVPRWQLSVYELAGVLGVLVTALIFRAEYLDTLTLTMTAGILIFILFTLYFTRSSREKSLLDEPVEKPQWLGWLILLFPFAALAWLGYDLSDAGETPLQADILFGAVTLFGALWLPILYLWLGYTNMAQIFRESYS